MYILSDLIISATFGKPLNKRLKRAFQRSLYPTDDAISAIQKGRGRKPTEVIAEGISRVDFPIDRNDPPKLTKRVIGTLKSIRQSPVEISQTLYANSKTGSVPNSRINRKLKTIGTTNKAELATRKVNNYDQAIHIHNHPNASALPSKEDIAAIGAGIPFYSGIDPKKSKGYITGIGGFHITKYKAEPQSLKDINKYKKTVDKALKQYPGDNETFITKGRKAFEANVKTSVKRVAERSKNIKAKIEQYGLD